MIQFSKPAKFASELSYVSQALESGSPWGGGHFYGLAKSQLQKLHTCQEVLLTQSCTSALELAALAIDISPGDEVIVPSYTFVSSANAFALRGAKIVFVDSRPSDLNLDLEQVEALLTPRTKAIVVVHYGGVACDMDRVMEIARRHGLLVIEDAAQAIGADYRGKALGTIGDLGCLSFHGTKNISSGEGGALLINTQDAEIVELARTAHEKGTDRSKFIRGEVDKYTWRSLGTSSVPSEFTSALLLAQLEQVAAVNKLRGDYWAEYYSALDGIGEGAFRLLEQGGEGSNFHMLALICDSQQTRTALREYLLRNGVQATSHYEPLHESRFAIRHFGVSSDLPVSTELSKRLLRLPLWSAKGLDTARISGLIDDFLKSRKSS